MCGSSKTSSTTSIPPEFLQAYQGVAGAAQNFYDTTKPQNYSDNPNDFVAQTNTQQRAGMSGVDNYANYAQPYYQSATGTLFNAANQGYMGTRQAQNTALGAGAAAAPYTGAFNQELNTGLGAGADYANKSQASLTAANQGASPYNQSADYFGRQAYQNASPYNTMAGQGISAALQGAQPYNYMATGLAGAGTQAVNADQIGGRQINQFMSPYIGSVLQGTAGMLNQQNQQAMSGQTGNAIMSGAFGGDRAGIAAANLQQQQQLANSKIYSDILNQGYGQALSAAQQQQGVNLSADQANRAALQQGAGQMLNIGQQGYGQGVGAAQAQGALGQQIYGQGMGLSQQQQGLGQQIFGQGTTTAEQQAAIGNQLFNQNSTAAGQNAAMAQQQYSQQLAMAQAQAAMAQQMYDQGASTSAATAGLGAGAQSAGLQGSQAQMAAGQIQQQTDQAAKQAMYNQWYQTNYGLPQELLGTYASTIEGIGQNAGSTTSTRAPGSMSTMLSDERLKENIHPIGKTNDGQTIYRYNFKGDHRTQIGLLAQEVEKHHPGAVGLAGGWKTVDYDKATQGSARAHRYAGGLVSAHEGGHVGMEHMGEGYADGGSPGGYDPNSMTELLHQQQGMYGNSGLGGATPPGAPSAPSTPYSPPAVAHATPPTPQSHDNSSQQQPGAIESTAKSFVGRKVVDPMLDKTWDTYAQKPVDNFIKGAGNKINSFIHPTTPPPPVSGGSGANALTGGMGGDALGTSAATAAGSAALPAAMLPAATVAADIPVAAAAVPAAVEGLTSTAAALAPEILALMAARGGSIRAHRAAGGLAGGRHGYDDGGTPVNDPNHVSFENSLIGKIGSGVSNLTQGAIKKGLIPPFNPAIPSAGNPLAASLAAGKMLQTPLALAFGGDKYVGDVDSSPPPPAAAKTAPPPTSAAKTTPPPAAAKTAPPPAASAQPPPPPQPQNQGLGGGKRPYHHTPRAAPPVAVPTAPSGLAPPPAFHPATSGPGVDYNVESDFAPTAAVPHAPSGLAPPSAFHPTPSGPGVDYSVESDFAPTAAVPAAPSAPPAAVPAAPSGAAAAQPSKPQKGHGLGQALHDALLPEGGYWDQLKGGKASAWIPLIQGISAAATSPYSNLGTALLYGAGVGASKYLPTQQAQAELSGKNLANVGVATVQQKQGVIYNPQTGRLEPTDFSGLDNPQSPAATVTKNPITVGIDPEHLASAFTQWTGMDDAAKENNTKQITDTRDKGVIAYQNYPNQEIVAKAILSQDPKGIESIVSQGPFANKARELLTKYNQLAGAAGLPAIGIDAIVNGTIIEKISTLSALNQNPQSVEELQNLARTIPTNSYTPEQNWNIWVTQAVANKQSIDKSNIYQEYSNTHPNINGGFGFSTNVANQDWQQLTPQYIKDEADLKKLGIKYKSDLSNFMTEIHSGDKERIKRAVDQLTSATGNPRLAYYFIPETNLKQILEN